MSGKRVHSKSNQELASSKPDSNIIDPTLLGRWSQTETTSAFFDVLAHFMLSCRSPHTRRNYGRDIREFYEFTQKIGATITNISDVTEKLVLLWEKQLIDQHTQYNGSRRRVVQTSVARKLSALSSLLTFAQKRKLLDQNCMENLTRPRIKRESKTNALTADEVKTLLALAEQECAKPMDGGPHHSRTYASARLRYVVMYTLFSVGMRVDELCELRIADLEVTPQCARLHMTTKGGETHNPIIHERTLRYLQQYIAEFRKDSSSGDLLFVRAQKVKQEVKLTQGAVYAMITELAARAGISKKVSPHSCRATLATMLHLRGIPIGQIQELLGHKQITTTAIYIKKANEVSEAAAAKIDILE